MRDPLLFELETGPHLHMDRGAATTAAEHVDETFLCKPSLSLSQVRRLVIIPSHSIRQSSVGVHMNEALGYLGQTLKEWPHLMGSQCTVQPHAEGFAVPNGCIEALVDESIVYERGEVTIILCQDSYADT